MTKRLPTIEESRAIVSSAIAQFGEIRQAIESTDPNVVTLKRELWVANELALATSIDDWVGHDNPNKPAGGHRARYD